MSTLIVRHVPESNPPRFQVLEPDGDATPPTELRPAAGYRVDGRPTSDLMAELRWYLEDFLEYPFHPETEHAERVLRALRNWAEDAFNALFGHDHGDALFARATAGGDDKLRLRIRSNDPRVLAWPWEALHRPGAGPLGQLSQVERCLDGLDGPPPFNAELPRDRVNILLVTARPYEDDVGFRSLSRPLIELVDKEKLPVDVHILRPPSFKRLREHLRERPQHYHILHFDGHGAYRPSAIPSRGTLSRHELRALDAHQLKGYQGCLVFEDKIGADDPITAPELSSLLREHAVPVVVLNACQSGMLDAAAETAFASVAAALLEAGTRSVVAMAYSLYVSGAQEFLPEFYRSLFASGNVAEGVRAGRRRMFREQGRVCARGRFDLEDWLVPVLYQQEDVDLSFAAEARVAAKASAPQVMELDGEPSPHGFVGRDGAILQLERALRMRPAGILVHGMGGVGKTTLARGFVEWLARTEGLGAGCFWITFQEVRSAEYVFNRMGEQFFGTDFAVLDAERKIAELSRVLRENRFVIVWDNFEVVAGIAGSSARPTLSEKDRGQLRAFLAALSGGRTKVLITSRSEEDWLKPERRMVSLSGLRGEERWTYCEEILGELGLTVDREDPELVKLMELLDGHPLSMRVLLPELEKRRAGELIGALQTNLAALDLDADEASAKLYATLGFVEEALDEELRPLLVPLAFHERFVQAHGLYAMAQQIESAPSRGEIDAFLRALANAGLLRELGQAIFEMHPALTGFLRSTFLKRTDAGVRDRWARAFVELFGSLADKLAPRKFHQQRTAIHLHGPNFLFALEEAEGLGMTDHRAALLQALGAFAEKQHSFVEAEEQYQKSLQINKTLGDEHGAAKTYHQLGRIAEESRNFDAAEKWYQKSLQINEKLGDENGAAKTYHQLGNMAAEFRDLDTAEKWYQKSLQIQEKLGNEHHAAITHHQLGRIAEESRNFDAAEKWYQKSLQINEKLGDENGAAITYHQLGNMAAEFRDLDTAEKWYQKSLQIKEKLGDEHGAAITYHQLGIVAEERRNFDAAEKWYQKSLQIKEKLGDEHGAAMTYHQLGIIAAERRDLDTAEKWYQKSLQINEKLGDKHHAAITYHQLGIIAEESRDFDAAEKWYQESLQIKEKLGNEHGAAITLYQLGKIAQACRDFEAAEKWYQESLQINERLGDKYRAASAYHQLGTIAAERWDFDTADKWYQKSLQIKEKLSDEHGAAITYHQLGIIAQELQDFDTAEKWYQKSLQINEKLSDEHGAAITYHQLGMIAQERRDFAAAEKWCQKSLQINEKLGDEHGAAITYRHLGIIAALRLRFEESGRWLLKSIQTFLSVNDSAGAQRNAQSFMVFYRQARPPVQQKLRTLWQDAGLPWPEDASGD